MVVSKSGIPVGVIEVKKTPKEIDIMNHPQVHGQILDYMLRLKSFHGLRSVFGIVSTYSQWRFYWLPECDKAAEASTVDEFIAVSGEQDHEEVHVEEDPINIDEVITIQTYTCNR